MAFFPCITHDLGGLKAVQPPVVATCRVKVGIRDGARARQYWLCGYRRNGNRGREYRARVRVGARVGVRIATIFEHRSRDRTRVDGVCDFEKVTPDQLCTSAKRD